MIKSSATPVSAVSNTVWEPPAVAHANQSVPRKRRAMAFVSVKALRMNSSLLSTSGFNEFIIYEIRKKEERRRKNEEGRTKNEEGRTKNEEGRTKNEEGRTKNEEGSTKKEEVNSPLPQKGGRKKEEGRKSLILVNIG
ncbi:hypothetical protein QUA00_29820 [Microcoleus sp. T2B6]|uniref:hypothetical protein n=1 Tax=Microcoleus sp. T2B6 TaxID=3055424 RepID=UPI002FD3C449